MGRSAPIPFSSCPIDLNPFADRGSLSISRSFLFWFHSPIDFHTIHVLHTDTSWIPAFRPCCLRAAACLKSLSHRFHLSELKRCIVEQAMNGMTGSPSLVQAGARLVSQPSAPGSGPWPTISESNPIPNEKRIRMMSSAGRLLQGGTLISSAQRGGSHNRNKDWSFNGRFVKTAVALKIDK